MLSFLQRQIKLTREKNSQNRPIINKKMEFIIKLSPTNKNPDPDCFTDEF